mmetsp:Transcript_21373/g.43482  ORF Transcript_21373/g.43482 Transcript_21373/m.43482 type:complete len:523 (+) Transcript_21373:702-2270(+)
MDSELTITSPYYQLLKAQRDNLDFLMPQFYNGITRPVIDGFANAGTGSVSTASVYTDLANDLFDFEPEKVVFGFCISDCSASNSNANAAQAVTVLQELKSYNNNEFQCNGGAFFWVAANDPDGSWATAVSAETSTGCESEQPSLQPSSQPSKSSAPSTQYRPSSSPSESAMPSLRPSLNPSKKPSADPSWSPSTSPTSPPPTSSPTTPFPTRSPTPAPTRSPSPYLWYPDWTGANEGCINDGQEPAYMVNNPSYLSEDLETCCSNHYNWMYYTCLGETAGGGIGMYYPDWTTNTGCLNDGMEPQYMTDNPTTFMHDTLASCCSSNFIWMYDDCMLNSGGGGVVTTTAPGIGNYYPDWVTRDTCVNDGNEPDYMSTNPEVWMHVTLESCCSRNYLWDYDNCIGGGGGGGVATTVVPPSAGLYYPDWENTDICLNDGNEPAYMSSNPTAWMLETLFACCEKYYSWKQDACMGGDGASATGQWFVDWNSFTCIQDQLGTLANSWDILHNSEQECCDTMVPWNDAC